jgi:3-oxoacyl-[acyl-carrier-protein] synthase II
MKAIFNARTVKTAPHRVVVVAAGVISPLGCGLAATLDSLLAARDCVSPVSRFSVERCRCKMAGQVPDAWLGSRPGDRREKRLHRASHMMIAALREAISQDQSATGRNGGGEQFRPELMVIGTTGGGMSYGEAYYRALCQHEKLRRSPGWIANYPPQKPVIDAQEAFGFSAPCEVIANACASGTNAIGHAFVCVRSGLYERVLTGGYDALSELVFVGFDSLQASTREKCRPFDRDRSGMVLGEGAAVLALENLETARRRGATILGEIIGYGISTDNFHLTQPNPSGIAARQAMERALATADIPPTAIDYINAHGTGTPLNDAAEGKAILEMFGETPVSSTKSMMGHSLGAAGAIESIVCLLALREQFLPPNINFRAPDQDVDLAVVANHARPAVLRRVLSNSFGFGGTNASIVMQKFDE